MCLARIFLLLSWSLIISRKITLSETSLYHFTMSEDTSEFWVYSPDAWLYFQNLLDSLQLPDVHPLFWLSILLNIFQLILNVRFRWFKTNHNSRESSVIQENCQPSEHHLRINNQATGQEPERIHYLTGCKQK